MIIICEPQCIGFEHAEFNAALISVVKNAYPHEKILFLAEKEHLFNVQNLLKTCYLDVCDYQEINVPERFDRESKRFLTEFKLVKYVFNLAKKIKTEKVIFSSITSPTLISIKFWLMRLRNIRCIVIPHSILETIVKYPHISRDFIFSLKIWIPLFNSDRLRYLVLGKPIEKELLTKIPKIRENVYSLNHPFFFRNNQINSLPNKIKFGFLGAGLIRKGIEDFFTLAENVIRKNENNVEFILIGQLLDKIKVSQNSVTISSHDHPLNREEYDNLSRSISYALFLYKKDQYKLIASGAFFDAISNLKPIIAIRNPFFEYYFNLMGNIGYLCDSVEEMENIVENIIEHPPKKHYIIQQENMLEGMKKLSFQSLAEEFKKALEY